MLLRRDAQELPNRIGIAERAMALPAGDAVARDQAVEIVAALARIEAPRELDAADRARLELDARAVELAPEETVIEARVVREEHPPRRAPGHAPRKGGQ